MLNSIAPGQKVEGARKQKALFTVNFIDRS